MLIELYMFNKHYLPKLSRYIFPGKYCLLFFNLPELEVASPHWKKYLLSHQHRSWGKASGGTLIGATACGNFGWTTWRKNVMLDLFVWLWGQGSTAAVVSWCSIWIWLNWDRWLFLYFHAAGRYAAISLGVPVKHRHVDRYIYMVLTAHGRSLVLWN